VVWLKAKPETIVRRMKIDDDSRGVRPSLTGKPASVEAVKVLSQRAPLYRQAADIEEITDKRSPERVAGEIIEALASMEKDAAIEE